MNQPRIRLALLLAAVFGSAAMLPARGGGLSLMNGSWSPADFDTDYGPSIRLLIEANPAWGIELRASLFPDMGRDIPDPENPVTVDLEVLPFEAGIIAHLPYLEDPLLQPYFGAGIGYYLLDLSARGPAGNLDYRIKDELGLYVTAGLRLHLSPGVALFGEAAYRWVEATARPAPPDPTRRPIDINLNGLGLGGGLAFFW
jgi:hypothetical protein